MSTDSKPTLSDSVNTPEKLLEWCREQSKLEKRWSENEECWEDPDDQWFFLGRSSAFESVVRILEGWRP